MANQIILKKSSTPGKAPVPGDLEYGELALNYSDGKLYYKKSDNSIAVYGTTGTGGGSVTSVEVSAGVGISISGSPITSSGTIIVTNTAPNITTDISITHNNSTVIVASSDGADGTINAATQSLAGIMSASDKIKLDGISAGAEVNQNAFSGFAVAGQTTVSADIKSDTLTIIPGANISITTDAANNSITFSALSYDLDGGFAGSTYTSSQLVDGGVA